MAKVVIVDYGMGNLHSVAKAVNKTLSARQSCIISDQAKDILAAERIILPGQGAMLGSMQNIDRQGLREAIVQVCQSKPVLAICIGPQLLMQSSEENNGVAGLGVFAGSCQKFRQHANQPRLKIPHMGWNTIAQTQTKTYQASDAQTELTASHPLFAGIANHAYFYFVHSYYLCPKDSQDIAGQTEYGQVFASVLARDNIFAMQCHPEKSAENGLRIFHNFLRWRI